MAISSCPECSKQVNDQDAACPSCGFPLVSRQAPPPAPAQSARAVTFTPASIGAIIVACIVGAFILMIVVSNNGSDQKELSKQAIAVIRSQIASDIQLEADPTKFFVYDGGRFYYACGEATLNRPDAGVLTLSNKTERVIVTMNKRTKGGFALFDGSDAADQRAEFLQAETEKCRHR